MMATIKQWSNHNQRKHKRSVYTCGFNSGWQNFPTQHLPHPRLRQLISLRQTKKSAALPKQGFTLLEAMIVVTVMGILMAIAATSWLFLLNNWRLNAAQDQVYHIITMAQSEAKQGHRRWQASFRTRNNQVEWVVHPVDPDLSIDQLHWDALPGQVQIDDAETTFYYSATDDIYRVQFDHHGHVNGRLGRLTLAGKISHKTRRCVFVSTLLGTLRKASDRPTPRNNRYCY